MGGGHFGRGGNVWVKIAFPVTVGTLGIGVNVWSDKGSHPEPTTIFNHCLHRTLFWPWVAGDELALQFRLAFGTGLLNDSNNWRTGHEGFPDSKQHGKPPFDTDFPPKTAKLNFSAVTHAPFPPPLGPCEVSCQLVLQGFAADVSHEGARS